MTAASKAIFLCGAELMKSHSNEILMSIANIQRTAPHAVLAAILLGLISAACAAGDDASAAGAAEAPIQADLSLVTDTLRPVVITERVLEDSDDPAIWIDPNNAASSIVLGSDKADAQGGVYVFDLAGKIDRDRSVTPLLRINNVDVEYGLEVAGQATDIAVATERHAMALRVFALPEMRPIDCGGIPVFAGDTARAPMGVALYRRPTDGAVFAIVGGKSGPTDGTYLWQYRLQGDAEGCVRGEKVREFGQYSGLAEIEAIAVDDELGYVYYSDEMHGVRKYHADPDAGNEELTVFATDGFVDDHEGITIYRREDGTGYILISDQGGSRLQVFPREGSGDNPHAHPALAVIPVTAESTDGLEVTSRSMGEAFPNGLLVMMSDDATFHYYRWEDVQAAIESVQ